jgi:hypothetical protein
MKLSKAAKARIKRMNMQERKKLIIAASLLADSECISAARYMAIHRTCKSN